MSTFTAIVNSCFRPCSQITSEGSFCNQQLDNSLDHKKGSSPYTSNTVYCYLVFLSNSLGLKTSSIFLIVLTFSFRNI